MANLFDVKNLQTHFHTEAGIVKAVDGVSFHVEENEIIGIVGESGCGKSVTMMSALQLIPSPPGEITGGEVWFEGQDLLKYKSNSNDMRKIRGAKISMVFQEPMTSLTPVLTIGEQICETMRLHLGLSRSEAKERAIELLKMVGIPAAESRINDYPHQFSGGMRQRAMIAMALSCKPKLLIADEPTTALDVTTQAVLLELMNDLVSSFNSSLVLITHNLGIVARYARRIYVMYAGRVVETGPAEDVFANPKHPYTIGLLRCVPRLDDDRNRELIPIKGMPPNLARMSKTCAFMPRCPYRNSLCENSPWPALTAVGENHFAACLMNQEGNVFEHNK